jgi:hypothetical protein
MQAVEFEAIPQDGRIRLPEGVPAGVALKVVLLWEPTEAAHDDLKELLASAVEGLSDEDLARPNDLGRPVPAWHS